MKKLFMLKDKNNSIYDVYAETLETAIQILINEVGGCKTDYKERF